VSPWRLGVTRVFLVGLAFDFCVRFSAGAYTRPLLSSTRAVFDTKRTLDTPYYPRTTP